VCDVCAELAKLKRAKLAYKASEQQMAKNMAHNLFKHNQNHEYGTKNMTKKQ
jgi:hypothetical protein